MSAFLAVTGIIHAINNLGGLLTLIHKQGLAKDNARVTIYFCYANFALVQLIT
jgi:hypothetical protein